MQILLWNTILKKSNGESSLFHPNVGSLCLRNLKKTPKQLNLKIYGSKFEKIYKLIKLRIHHFLLKIIISFLRKRSFCEKIANSFSETRQITADLSQGAVLSSTLFNFFINDFPKKINNNIKMYSLLLADELIFMRQFKRKEVNIEKSTN